MLLTAIGYRHPLRLSPQLRIRGGKGGLHSTELLSITRLRLTAPFAEQLFQRQHFGADVPSHRRGVLFVRIFI